MTSPQWGRQPWGRGAPPPSPYGPAWGQQPYGSPFGAPRGYPAPYARGPLAPPPRRRRNPLASLLLGLILLTVVALGGLVFANGTQETPQGSYQNEDYEVPPPDTNPPPLPVPETYQEAEGLITDNRLYAQTVPNPVRCEAPPINVESASNAQLDRHFEGLMACLVRAWEPPMSAAGWTVVRPTVTIYGSEITTRCGRTEVNAFYCGADQQVYYSSRLPDVVRIVRQDRWAADVVMAHEFGHAIQARTAILISAKALGQQSGDQQTDLELSRRLETQADCFSGMFLRAVSEALGIEQADVDGILDTYSAVGDDILSGNPNINGNHGLARSRRYWGSAGLGTSDVGECNTFRAERALVR